MSSFIRCHEALEIHYEWRLTNKMDFIWRMDAFIFSRERCLILRVGQESESEYHGAVSKMLAIHDDFSNVLEELQF